MPSKRKLWNHSLLNVFKGPALSMASSNLRTQVLPLSKIDHFGVQETDTMLLKASIPVWITSYTNNRGGDIVWGDRIRPLSAVLPDGL